MGYCHCHLKCVLRSIRRVQTENCTIDKQSPYLKLLLFSKRVLLVIVSETVEWAIALSETVKWAIATLVAPLELYCAIVSKAGNATALVFFCFSRLFWKLLFKQSSAEAKTT